MKSSKKILVAFLLNLFFSVVEFLGGAFTGSVAILSDAVHDLGDAVSIGVSWFLEKKSLGEPDERYTYGYARYSVMGGVVTTLVLLAGSSVMIFHSVERILHPSLIHYNGMIALGIFGVVVNFLAAFLTRGGDSLNQKAVNLHMLEDVLGWVVVLIGAVIMRLTSFALLDPLMSIVVSLIVLIGALKNLRDILNVLLEKAPEDINIPSICEELLAVDGIREVHHFHLWTMDGQSHYATLHIITDKEPVQIKETVREVLNTYQIHHATLELETPEEECPEKECHLHVDSSSEHHHHHHHHHS